ncbi:MAG: zinc ribbon domain-containing protein [Coriobacteriia bacterium]|nr:zinc ribbon domain-containing protein [Coriobacteriia bacterium]MBN2821988.1 zinc ribbon domain-containing protein [Coriobacteriia bacterium]
MRHPVVLPPCPTCGAMRQAPDSRFCVQCGTPLPAPRKKHTALWITLGILMLLLACTAIVVITNALAILDHGGTLI